LGKRFSTAWVARVRKSPTANPGAQANTIGDKYAPEKAGSGPDGNTGSNVYELNQGLLKLAQ
jgi:hypothetical protein